MVTEEKPILKVLSVDPGRTTGFCWATIEEGQAILMPWQQAVPAITFYKILEKRDPDIVIIEKFQFRKNSTEGLDMFPRELIGVARLWIQQNPTARQMVEQSPSYGMGYWNDKSLKKADVYARGMPHAMDALRHFLHWFTFGPGYQYQDQKSQYPFRLITSATAPPDRESETAAGP